MTCKDPFQLKRFYASVISSTSQTGYPGPPGPPPPGGALSSTPCRRSAPRSASARSRPAARERGLPPGRRRRAGERSRHPGAGRLLRRVLLAGAGEEEPRPGAGERRAVSAGRGGSGRAGWEGPVLPPAARPRQAGRGEGGKGRLRGERPRAHLCAPRRQRLGRKPRAGRTGDGSAARRGRKAFGRLKHHHRRDYHLSALSSSVFPGAFAGCNNAAFQRYGGRSAAPAQSTHRTGVRSPAPPSS